MAASIRQLIYSRLVSRLESISVAAGYTNNVRVYETWKDCWNSDYPVAISVEFGDEDTDVEKWTLGSHGGGPVAVELVINILVRWDGSTTSIMSLANSALQDVRNAIMANLDAYQFNTGAHFAALGTVTTDQGILSFEDKVLFTQPVVFKYNAGPTW